RQALEQGAETVEAQVGDRGVAFCLDLSGRERRLVLAGGLLNLIKEEG
ncbi:MAG: hypothetical protein JRC92_09035, partial [Deltaproteobacteria bacterium]|nr:hypothetical protein [Deltaproteobacteria bacterium]